MSNALSGAHSSDKASASDEVIDAIAEIEVKRRETETEAGLASSCSSALRKLHELLEREKGALAPDGAGAGHPGNVEAVMIEIERLKRLAVTKAQGPASRNGGPAGMRQEPRQKSWKNAPSNPGRSRGRRTMGRASGR